MSCSSKRNIEVGSCISTLVSRTKRRRVTRSVGVVPVTAVPDPSGDCSSQGLRRFKYFLHVTLHLHLAPFAPQVALRIKQEGAALDSQVLASVKGFFLDHSEQLAHLLSGVGQQWVGQLFLQAEFLMRCERVARDTHDRRTGFAE